LTRMPMNCDSAVGSKPPGRCSKRPGEEREVAIAMEVLLSLPDHAREALIHYYQGRDRAEATQLALGLSAAEFRDFKATAKARWAALCAIPVSEEPRPGQIKLRA
jgi:hypothetical protein